MTDFSSLISNPKLMILGAAAQLGIFLTFLGALVLVNFLFGNKSDIIQMYSNAKNDEYK